MSEIGPKDPSRGIARRDALKSLLIGGAADHDPVHPTKMRLRFVERGDATIEHDCQTRMRRFETIDAIVIERRQFAVFFWREPFQPRFSGMYDQRVGPGAFHGLRKHGQSGFRILFVNTDAAFHGHRNCHCGLHRGDTVADQVRLGHQAGPEAALLHAIRWATDIEIDFIKPAIRSDPCTSRQRLRIGAAELECQRMLGRVIAQKPRPIAVQHCAHRQHFSIEQRAPRQQTMEEPAVPVGPFHHRSDTESVGPIFIFGFRIIGHYSFFLQSHVGEAYHSPARSYVTVGITGTQRRHGIEVE